MITDDILERCDLQDCNAGSFAVNQMLNVDGSIMIGKYTTILVDGECILVSDILKKLKLLDKLIEQYLPEELV